MQVDPLHPDLYLHARVLVSVVVGLGITRLLSGVSRFIQHPGRHELFATHLVWVATILIAIMHFWWAEFLLMRQQWNVALFAFVMFYAFLLYLLTTLLFPDGLEEYSGYEDYFMSRRAWFFGLLAITLVVDFADTAIKGREHLEALGPEYKVRLPIAVIGCLVAAVIRNRRFQLSFALVYLGYTISWVVRAYWQIA